MSVLVVAGVVAVVMTAATLQTISGFGFALVSVPVLAILIGAKDAVAATSLFSLCSAMVQLGLNRQGVNRSVAARLTGGALAGMPLGLLVLLAVDERVLRGAIAITVLVFVVVLAVGLRPRGRGFGLDVGAGFVSGVLNTSVSTNGPPLVLALQARGLSPIEFRGTISATFVLSNAVAVILFAGAGRYGHASLTAAVVGIPALIVGWVIGARISRRFPQQRFRALVFALLVASSCSALVSLALG